MNHESNSPAQITVDFITSPGFNEFLRAQRLSLAVSTYQSGNLFLFGAGAGEQLRARSIVLERPMGICPFGESLYVGGLYQIHQFNNVIPKGRRHEGSDRLFIPQLSWTVGEIDCHDLVVEKFGRIVFVNTLYSCLAAVSSEESFIPIWKPPTTSAVVPEDRCHLNGVALRDGSIRYASAFSRTDAEGGWRENNQGTGVVWDILSNQVVVEGLAMPHSPRWSDDRLWLLESGSGSFGYIDCANKSFVKLLSFPGYLRGLAFHGRYAVVGSSIPRAKSSIDDAEILSAVARDGGQPFCGLIVINLETMQVEHTVRIGGDIQEIFDIAVLPGVEAPDGVGMRDKRIRYVHKIGPHQCNSEAASPASMK